LFVLKITGTEVLNYSGRRECAALPLIVRDEPGRPRETKLIANLLVIENYRYEDGARD
jgi:hypothetical protein